MFFPSLRQILTSHGRMFRLIAVSMFPWQSSASQIHSSIPTENIHPTIRSEEST